MCGIDVSFQIFFHRLFLTPIEVVCIRPDCSFILNACRSLLTGMAGYIKKNGLQEKTIKTAEGINMFAESNYMRIIDRFGFK